MTVRIETSREPLPGYRLVERLGRGGFGEVWKVEAPGGLLKAMKFVFGDLESADEDGKPAEQELKALHRVKTIRHPYILSLERFDIIEGQLIIVMELADRNLWDRLRECRSQGLIGIPREELLRYMEEAAEALDLMNDHHQIQHLDIKPQNIFLVHNHIKVADFGLAKLFEGERATVTGGVTPVYAPPETFEGWISRFSDQYSLAIVYQELLTGARPFTGSNTKQLLMQHINGVPELSPLPEHDRVVISRALSKKPDDRWPNCAEMVRALRAATNGTPMPRNVGSGSTITTELLNWKKSDTPAPGANPANPGLARRAPTATQEQVAFSVNPVPTQLAVGGAGLVTVKPSGGAAGLVIPRLVTPNGNPTSSGTTATRPPVFQTGRMNSLGIAPPEKNGDGVLIPALIVAVGGTGWRMVQRFRQMIRETFGSSNQLPCLRFLYIDTDSDAIAESLEGQDALTAGQTVLARLNRPAHYLQQAATSNAEQWLPSGQLYRLPKNTAPASGVRSFGRLALCDNYRVIAQRIRQEFESFLSDDELTKSNEQTGLGIRSNRARAYLLSSLAGGTGSGMALDLGYILKQEFRSIGYRKPDTIGIFMSATMEKAPKNTATANTYATLAELYYFSSGNRYQVRFDPSEPAIADPEPPFSRTSLLAFPRSGHPTEIEHCFNQAARGLFVDLLTTAGRVTDYVRSVAPAHGDLEVPSVTSFGVFRWSWPRAELLVTAMNRFNSQLLSRWCAKETTHLKEPIEQWISEQLVKQKLNTDSIMSRLTKVARETLREDPDAVFEAAIDTLRTRTPGNYRLDAPAACVVFDQLIKLVGKPDQESENAGVLEVAVKEIHHKIAKEADSGFAKIAVSFIEQPQYRIAGAEEALNQLTNRLKEQIEQLETERKTIERESKESYARLFQIIGSLGNSTYAAIPGRRNAMATELLEQFRTFATKRLRLIYVNSACTIYRSLLGTIPDYLREVGFCRTRLTEIAHLLAGQEPAASDPKSEALILPAGCKTISEAADQFLAALPPEDILQFEQALQKELVNRFKGLVSLCVRADRTPDFVQLLNNHTRTYLGHHFQKEDPAAVFLRYVPSDQQARDLVSKGIECATPKIRTSDTQTPPECLVLAAPDSEQGSTVLQLVVTACAGREVIPAPLADDILIYREYPRLPMPLLPQLGLGAREAYIQFLGTDHPPHARMDIAWPTCED